MPIAVFLPRVQVKMFCHFETCEFGARDTQKHSNAFLSSSICGGSAPLVSLPISTSFLKTVGYKTEQDNTPTARAPAC